MVSRNGYPDYIELVELFVCLHEVQNPLLEAVKHAELYCMEEEVGLREVTHDKGNMSKPIQSLVNTVWQVLGIGSLSVGIAERST